MFLSLNGEALDAALELEEVISGKDRLKSIVTHLDKLYKEDDTLSKFHTLESFETYKRPSTLSIPEYINEFEKRLHNVKNYGTEMSDDILAYRLLKNANLKQSKEQLIIAAISDLRYNLMKEQLKKYSVTCHLPAKVLRKDGQQVLVKHGSTYVCCHPCCLSLEQSNQHQESLQAQTASSNNSDSDSDTNTLRITELPRQKLTAINSSVASSDCENEHTDNCKTLKQKYHSKEIISNAEDPSLYLHSQLSFPQRKATNINKEPKKDMIICLKTYKQDSWKQVKILSRAGKVGKSKSGKYKNHWNASDDQGYTKVIDFENNVKEWEEIKSDCDDETTQHPSQSLDHLSKSLSDLQI